MLGKKNVHRKIGKTFDETIECKKENTSRKNAVTCAENY